MIASEIIKTICLNPIKFSNRSDVEQLVLRIEIHQEAVVPKMYFAVIWRVETYVTIPKFQPDGREEQADHLQLVVDDYLTDLFSTLRTKTVDELEIKILGELSRMFHIEEKGKHGRQRRDRPQGLKG